MMEAQLRTKLMTQDLDALSINKRSDQTWEDLYDAFSHMSMVPIIIYAFFKFIHLIYLKRKFNVASVSITCWTIALQIYK